MVVGIVVALAVGCATRRYFDFESTMVSSCAFDSLGGAKTHALAADGLAMVERMLASRDPIVRECAVEIAGWQPPARFLPQVSAIAADAREVERVRVMAVETLNRYRDPTAVPLLVSLLREWPTRVAVSSFRALGSIDDPTALDALRDEVSTASGARLITAVAALGRQGAAESCVYLQALRERLEWEAPFARIELATALILTLNQPCVDDALALGELLRSNDQSAIRFLAGTTLALSEALRLRPAQAAMIEPLLAEIFRRFP